MRIIKKFRVEDHHLFKEQLIRWSQQYGEVLWLDSNDYSQKYGSFESLLAIDAFTSIKTDELNAFNDLKEYQSITKDWIFGYLTYDLKNDLENLVSNNTDNLSFPDLYFFQPKKIIIFKNDGIEFHYLNMVDDELESDFTSIKEEVIPEKENLDNESVRIKLRIHKDEYYAKVNSMLEHIQRGDIYEANFCQEFYAEDTLINPLETYLKLNELSMAPFATFLRIDQKYLLSASPERYLRKENVKIISQPIKGTAKRSEDNKEDQLLKTTLKTDEKERSENIMIVDLVRNDLSKWAVKGSVAVEELCEVYTFKQVHQMISTVVAKVENNTAPVNILRESFPMGSMTGAPKIAAMKIIEELEETKRGLYSGAVGYFTPDGDFDFNVIIRSILYDETQQYVSFSVGSAITSKSIPEREYEECLIKAKAMREVLEGN